jgi:hypothetical protein
VRQAPSNIWHKERDILRAIPELLLEDLHRARRNVFAQSVDERQIRRGRVRIQGLAYEHAPPSGCHGLTDFRKQPRLAYTGLTAEQDNTEPALLRRPQVVGEQAEFAIACYKRISSRAER